MAQEIDDSRWPWVETRWRGAATDAEVDRFLARMDLWLARHTPFYLLIDSRGAWGLDATQRARIIQYMRDTAGLTGQLLVQAVVFDNPVQRALYFAVVWVFPMPFPSKAFSEPDAARRWLALQMRERQEQPGTTF